MHAPYSAAGNALQWVRPRLIERQYELREGETVLATLVRTEGIWRALGEWGDVRYQFSREGRYRPRSRIVVHLATDAAGEPVEPIAAFRFAGDVLTFPDGRMLGWKRPRWWRTERAWVDRGGVALVQFRPPILPGSVAVTISPLAESLSELPLLILLGEYLLLVRGQQGPAAVEAGLSPM